MANQPQRTIKDFIDDLNKLQLTAFNSKTKRSPDVSITLPSGATHFVNRSKVDGKWQWVLGPEKIKRAPENQAALAVSV